MILYMAPGNIRLYLNTTFNLPIAYLSDLVTLDSSLPPLTVSVAALSRQKVWKWSEILIQFMAGYFSTSPIKASKASVEHNKRKAIMKCHRLSFTLCVDSVDRNDQVKKLNCRIDGRFVRTPFEWTNIWSSVRLSCFMCGEKEVSLNRTFTPFCFSWGGPADWAQRPHWHDQPWWPLADNHVRWARGSHHLSYPGKVWRKLLHQHVQHTVFSSWRLLWPLPLWTFRHPCVPGWLDGPRLHNRWAPSTLKCLQK